MVLKAQTTDFVEEYNRNALSVFVVGGATKYAPDILGASAGVVIPDKFDDNNLEIRSLKVSGGNSGISNELKQEQISNQIVAKWFSRDTATGLMDMTVIHDRGLYNATDAEVRQASTTKIGMANLQDAGESLINRSYVVVMEFHGIQSMRQVYNKRDLAKKAASEALNQNYQPVRRVKNGWVGNATAYLYKLDFNDSIMGILYNDLWIYGDDDEEAQLKKKALFAQINLPIKFVGQAVVDAEGTQYNAGHPMAGSRQLSRNELFQKMLNSGLDGSVFQMERLLEDFKVKAPIYDVKPVRAKIGKKEGVKTDQRYFAIESFQKEDGKTVTRRKGVVRAKYIIDNREVATGKSDAMTSFYQTAGLKIEPGMVLHQRNDYGVGISGGVSFGEIGGGWAKLEYNISQAANLPGITQLKFFAYGGIENKSYTMNQSWLNTSGTYDFDFIRWQVGLSKGFYIARNISFAPFVSYGAETGQNTQFNRDNGMRTDDFVGTDFINYGAYATINILHNIQIIAAFNYYTPLWYTYTKQRNIFDYGAYQNKKYTEWFDNRRNMSIDAGVRIEF